jgi:hypothetical protein
MRPLVPVLEAEEQQNFVAVIRRIWAGEREEEELCTALSLNESMVVIAILAGIADPATLEELRIEE